MDGDDEMFGEMNQAPAGDPGLAPPPAGPEAGYDFVGGGYEPDGGDAGASAMAMGYSQQASGAYASLDDDGDGGMGQGGAPGGDSMGGDMFQGMPEPEEVADNALTRFMAEWELKLREKAASEEQHKQQVLQQARADQDKFTADRALKRETRMNANRTQEQVFLEQLESDLESDNPWERIVSLVDTQTDPSGPFLDTGRMKTMLIQLKNDPIPIKSS